MTVPRDDQQGAPSRPAEPAVAHPRRLGPASEAPTRKPAGLAPKTLAGLAIAGDFAITALDQSTDDNTLISVTFATFSILSGVLIGRWWASLIAIPWIVTTAITSTPTQESSDLLILSLFLFFGITHALLIAAGVAIRKSIRHAPRPRHRPHQPRNS